MDGSNRNGTRAGLRGRGGRGMLMDVGLSNNDNESTTNEIKTEQSEDVNSTENFQSPMNSDINKSKNELEINSPQKDSETKRERKSRWGENEKSSNIANVPHIAVAPVIIKENIRSTSGENESVVGQTETNNSDNQPHENVELDSSTKANENSDISQPNGCIGYSDCLNTEKDEQLPVFLDNSDQKVIPDSCKQSVEDSDAVIGHETTDNHFSVESSQQIVTPENSMSNEECYGKPQNTIPSGSECMAVQCKTSEIDSESTIQCDEKFNEVLPEAAGTQISSTDGCTEASNENRTDENILVPEET